MTDILAELFTAQNQMPPTILGVTTSAGLTRRELFNFEIGLGGRFAIVPILTDAGGNFQFAADGAAAFIMAGQMGDDLAADLVAFYLDQPTRWWRRLGVIDVLNYDAVLRASCTGELLTLWPTPLDWLQASMNGAVILDHQMPLAPLLDGVSEVFTPDVNHGRRLQRQLHQPIHRFPTITVPSEADNAA